MGLSFGQLFKKSLTGPIDLIRDPKGEMAEDTGMIGGLLGLGPKEAMSPPPPPPPPPLPPDMAGASDRVRAERAAADAQRRKRGRRSTVITGPEGVGDTPLGRKTLVGS